MDGPFNSKSWENNTSQWAAQSGPIQSGMAVAKRERASTCWQFYISKQMRACKKWHTLAVMLQKCHRNWNRVPTYDRYWRYKRGEIYLQTNLPRKCCSCAGKCSGESDGKPPETKQGKSDCTWPRWPGETPWGSKIDLIFKMATTCSWRFRLKLV